MYITDLTALAARRLPMASGYLIGEQAGTLLVLAKLKSRFSRLIAILADQGFDGVDFIRQVKTTFGLTLEVVYQVLSVKGFQPGRQSGGA